jgi:hypothetical protein
MSEYRFVCPRCGHAFLEGTAFTRCPECQVPLLQAAPNLTADLRKLPEHLDLDVLMQQALAEQQPEEHIDAVLQRVAERAYPEAHEGLYHLLRAQLDMWQRLRGLTRQETAEQLAKARSELQKRPDGTPELQTIFPIEFRDVRLVGGENLSAEEREQVVKQIEETLAAGKPIQSARITLPAAKGKAGCASLVLAIGLLAILVWAVYRG